MPTLVTRPTRRPPGKRERSIKIFLALVGALLVHLLLILAVLWVVPHWPRGRVRARSRPIELTLVPPAAPTPPPVSPATGAPTPPYMRTTDDQLADKPPDDPSFISDKDTQAASLLAANGQPPLPSTEGKEIPTFDFEPRPYRLGPKAADAATSAPSAAAAQEAQVATPPPTPPPVNKQPPLPVKNRPNRKPVAQPTPSDAGDLATLKAEASPSPEPPVPTPAETPRDEESSAPPPRQGRQAQVTTAAPSNVTSNGAPKPPGYQPQSMATKMTGSINNRGRPAVSAVGTPLGRYQKSVYDQIGMLWYSYSENPGAEVSTGTVKIHFYVTRDGTVKNVTFTGGNANGALGLVSERSINEADIPPMPPEVASTVGGLGLEEEISFTCY